MTTGEDGRDGRLRVLVADDQPEHQEMIARALAGSRHHGRFEVVRAEDGHAALDGIRRGVDLAFLDIQMPGRTGLDVLAIVRATQDTRDVPVVIVSSSADPRDLEAAQRLGAYAYVQKGRYPPFRDRIVQVVDAVLDGKAL